MCCNILANTAERPFSHYVTWASSRTALYSRCLIIERPAETFSCYRLNSNCYDENTKRAYGSHCVHCTSYKKICLLRRLYVLNRYSAVIQHLYIVRRCSTNLDRFHSIIFSNSMGTYITMLPADWSIST